MRTISMLILALGGACGGAISAGGSATGPGGQATDAGQSGNAAVWWPTCGAPACSHDAPPAESGLPYCSPGLAGNSCATVGEECDLRDCDVHLLCSTSDPRKQSSIGCPVSRARLKKDIHYLSEDELRGRSRELLDLPLAAYRYREGDRRIRLGFLIDGHESLACVDGDRVDLYGYTSMAVAALKVQAEEIAALHKQVAEVQKELARRRR